MTELTASQVEQVFADNRIELVREVPDWTYHALPIKWFLESGRRFLGFKIYTYKNCIADCDDFAAIYRAEMKDKAMKSGLNPVIGEMTVHLVLGGKHEVNPVVVEAERGGLQIAIINRNPIRGAELLPASAIERMEPAWV